MADVITWTQQSHGHVCGCTWVTELLGRVCEGVSDPLSCTRLPHRYLHPQSWDWAGEGDERDWRGRSG